MEFLPFRSRQPPSSHYGGEREQMLNLNQRLETYLNRVKLLDEENAKLAKEIQTLRRNHHGNQERRKFMDEELRCARREVDTMWKERVYAEVDVARLAEELQTLDLQLRRETQAHIEANAKVDQSRRELEEERRAQIWLTEKVNQLEHEMKSLIQTHQEEVTNMEHMLMQTKVMPTMKPSVQQGPSLLELGEEYNQRVTRAWQEAAEAYQGQLARLEESVNETRQRLVQVNKENSESVMKLQNLDREMLGLQDLREHLESTVDQQRESHCRDIQMLQEHLEALEREKHVLTQKMDQLLQENRGLVQMKMSLNMEVATYRALLDNESLKGNATLQKQPRNIYSKDAVFSPWGDHYQLSPSTSSPPLRSGVEKTKPSVITATPIRYQKYVPRREKLEISKEKVEDNKVFQQPELTPYPKVLKDGAVENFRPQEVNEKVTYAEPLSPPDEQEKTLDLEKIGDNWNDTVDQPSEGKLESNQKIEARVDEANIQLEPAVSEESCSFSVKSEPMEKQNENEEYEKPQAPIHVWIEEEMVSKMEQPYVRSSLGQQLESSSNLEEPIIEATPEVAEEAFTEEVSSGVVKAQQETPFVNREEIEKPQEPIDAWVENESTEDTKAAQEQVESSDSETQAFIETNFDTKSSSPASECEHEESLQNQLGDIVQEEFTFDSVHAATDGTSPPKEKLYPDGEEMDTWDSVMEQNQGLNADDLEQSPEEGLKQHAEPEEDISAKEVHQQMQEVMPVEGIQAKFEPEISEIGDEGQKNSIKEDLPNKSEDEEQEDSQNVSVSWQTELEGDSYAQDNTLADTRPLIRYKSDETDGNTQASHIDDVDDSSDGEQEKKVGEMGSGTWIEDQTRRFGTMEDLCEEADGEVLDEEYDLEYLRKDGKEDKEEMDTCTQEEDKTQEEVIKTVVEEELDTDKLVEQELENLTTEWYTTHFMHQQTGEKDTLQNETAAEEPIAWGEALEGMPEATDEEDFHTNETLVEQKSDEHFEEVPQQQKDEVVKEVQESVEVEEEDKHNVSMVTHCNTTEDITEFRQESVWSSTSQELSFEQKEPENMGEQPEEKESIVQDMPTKIEEEDKLSVSMVTHCDTTEDVTEFRKEPENMREQAEEKESIDEDMLTKVEEEDKHNVSMVTHCDTTEDITELRKESVWSSTSQELSFEQKEPENMGEQAEEKKSIVQDMLTKVEEENIHTTEDIRKFMNEPENMGEQAEEKQPIVHDMQTGNVDQLINENESNKLLLSSTVESVTPDNGVEMRDTTPEEIFMPEEVDTEFPEALATSEWEVVENPTKNIYHDDKIASDLTPKGLSGDDKADHDSLSPMDEPLNMSPESVHEDSDLFIVKDSKELLKTNGKTSLDDMFSMNTNNDFWVSPLETGATYQPDDVNNKHTEWKLGFGDVEGRETEEFVEKTDMAYEQKDVSQIFTKTVVKGEIVHSEESEDDSEAMSSGEE